jgi:hypothetical protein
VATIERKALKKVKLALMELGYDEQYFARVFPTDMRVEPKP